MAKCELCNKTPQSGNRVSHSKRHTKHMWKLNIHPSTIDVNGVPTKMKVCSRCLRTHYKLDKKAKSTVN